MLFPLLVPCGILNHPFTSLIVSQWENDNDRGFYSAGSLMCSLWDSDTEVLSCALASGLCSLCRGPDWGWTHDQTYNVVTMGMGGVKRGAENRAFPDA